MTVDVEMVARALAKAQCLEWETLSQDDRHRWMNAAELFVCRMGGAAELFAFCEAVLATRAASC